MACNKGHQTCNCPPGLRGPQGLPGNTTSDLVSGVVSGHQIAVHTSVAGVPVTINETITSLVYAPVTGILTYTNEAGVANTITIPGASTEEIQDAIGPFIAGTGLFVYNDAGNSLILPAGAVAGQVPTVNAGATGIVYQTPSSGGVTITSPLGTVSVGGSASAPTVDVTVEGVQDIVGPFVAGVGLVTYDDAANQLKLPAAATAGQVATVNPTGTGIVYQTPVASTITITSPDNTVTVGGTSVAPTLSVPAETIQDVAGPFLAVTGLVTYNDGTNSVAAAGAPGQVPVVNGAGGFTYQALITIDVEKYGAISGINIDQSAALQTAINLAATTGATVWSAPGKTYRVSTPLTFPANLKIDFNFSVIWPLVALATVIDVTGKVDVSNLDVSGDRLASNGIRFTNSVNANGSVFTKVRVRQCLTDGFVMDSSDNCNSLIFSGLRVSDNGTLFRSVGIAAVYAAGTIGVSSQVLAAGTVAVTAGSAIVTGTGTAFTTLGLRKGDLFRIKKGASDHWGQVLSVQSNTQLTMVVRLPSTFTDSGCDYAIGVGSGFRSSELVGDCGYHTFTSCSAHRNANAGFLECTSSGGSTHTGSDGSYNAGWGFGVGLHANDPSTCVGWSSLNHFSEGNFGGSFDMGLAANYSVTGGELQNPASCFKNLRESIQANGSLTTAQSGSDFQIVRTTGSFPQTLSLQAASVAALRAIPPSFTGLITQTGFAADRDGCTGTWQTIEGSSLVDDGAMVITPTGASTPGVRRVRVWDGVTADIRWFGASAIASGAVNSAAFAAANAAASVVQGPEGRYFVSSPVDVPIRNTLRCLSAANPSRALDNFPTGIGMVLVAEVVMPHVVAVREHSVVIDVVVNGNQLATDGFATFSAASAALTKCGAYFCRRDGFHAWPSGNNNMIELDKFNSAFNGRVFGSPGGRALFSFPIPSQSVAASGTVSVSAGSGIITGTGTAFTTLGLRRGDPLVVKSGASTYLAQIVSIDSDTQIDCGVRFLPSFTASGCDWAVGRGSGVWQDRWGDNNVWSIRDIVTTGNAGYGLKVDGLYGSTTYGGVFQATRFGGVAVGVADNVAPVFATQLVSPYFENDSPFDRYVWVGFALGLTISEPVALVQAQLLFHNLAVQTEGVFLARGKARPLHPDLIDRKGELFPVDLPSIAAGASATVVVPVAGATSDDAVWMINHTAGLQGLRADGWVSGAGQVTVRFDNPTGAAIDLPGGQGVTVKTTRRYGGVTA